MKLRDYQNKTLDYMLSRKNALVFLDMGLGKTATTLHAIMHRGGTTLIVAPPKVLKTWTNEIDKWDLPLTYNILTGTKKTEKYNNNTADIMLVSNSSLSWFVSVNNQKYTTLVIDELSKFKDSTTKRFNDMQSVEADYRIGLTATPLTESYLNVWSQAHLIDKDLFQHSFFDFRREYFKPGRRLPNKVVIEWICINESEIERRLEGFMMKASDVINMPDVKYHNEIVMPLEGQISLLNDIKRGVVNGFILDTSGIRWQKALQPPNGFMYIDNKPVVECKTNKHSKLKEIVAKHDSIIVMYNYTYEKDILKELLPNGVFADTMKDVEKEFKGGILFAHAKSIGHGLNLQENCSTLVWLSLPLSLEEYLQCNARIYRGGQKNKVNIYHILVANTLDMRLMLALANKEKAIDKFMKNMGGKYV